jgi:hypothetical protein
MSAARNEYLDSSPSPWSIVRKSLPPTGPANVTVPAAGAWTGEPTVAAMSMPR